MAQGRNVVIARRSKELSLLVCALILASCVFPEELRHEDETTCIGYGTGKNGRHRRFMVDRSSKNNRKVPSQALRCFPDMLPIIVGLFGVILLAITAQDSFEVMLLPRRVLRRLRFVGLFYRLTWAGWSGLASRCSRNRRRAHLLGVFGALSMVLLFSVWIAGLIIGFGLVLWAVEVGAGVSPPPGLGDELYMSGVTFFTLGYGDLIPHSGLARLVTVLEAGTGLGFIAIVIGYLPVLYQLFSCREVAVIRLDGRAGSPPTAVGLLQRHGGDDGPGQIIAFLREWESWGSELFESHLSYPGSRHKTDRKARLQRK